MAPKGKTNHSMPHRCCINHGRRGAYIRSLTFDLHLTNTHTVSQLSRIPSCIPTTALPKAKPTNQVASRRLHCHFHPSDCSHSLQWPTIGQITRVTTRSDFIQGNKTCGKHFLMSLHSLEEAKSELITAGELMVETTRTPTTSWARGQTGLSPGHRTMSLFNRSAIPAAVMGIIPMQGSILRLHEARRPQG